MAIWIDPVKLMRLAVLISQGRFHRAAEKLRLTQPALSQSIAQLESEVGVKLIERTPHGVEPTVYGLALYHHAKVIDWELSQAVQRIQELSAGSKGALIVGASVGAAMNMASSAAARLLSQQAGIRMRLVEEASISVLCNKLRDRAVDLLICLEPPELDAKGLKVVPLFMTRRIACIRRGHPLGAKPEMLDLLRYPFVRPADGIGALSSIEDIFERLGLDRPQQEIISNSVSATKEMIVGSDSFAFLSDLAVWRERISGEIVGIELGVEQGSWYHIVIREEHAPSEVTKLFLAEIFHACEQREAPVHDEAKAFARRIVPTRH